MHIPPPESCQGILPDRSCQLKTSRGVYVFQSNHCSNVLCISKKSLCVWGGFQILSNISVYHWSLHSILFTFHESSQINLSPLNLFFSLCVFPLFFLAKGVCPSAHLFPRRLPQLCPPLAPQADELSIVELAHRGPPFGNLVEVCQGGGGFLPSFQGGGDFGRTGWVGLCWVGPGSGLTRGKGTRPPMARRGGGAQPSSQLEAIFHLLSLPMKPHRSGTGPVGFLERVRISLRIKADAPV